MWVLLNRHMGRLEGLDGESEVERGEAAGEDPDLELQNPFELAPALKFAALLTAIIGGANFLQGYYGEGAIYVAAVFGGLAETNAISLAIARLENLGELSADTATRAIVIAILANSFVKALLSAIIGSRRLGGYVALGLVPILAAGLGATFWLI